jgi:hypothetical protein
MSSYELYPGQALERIKETKSCDNKNLPLGFSKFNARDAKDVFIPVFKSKNKK